MAKYDFSDFDEEKNVLDFSDFEESKPEISNFESGARGAAQGLSFGFSDEIEGGAKALSEVMNKDASSLEDLYNQYMTDYTKNRDEARTKNKQAADENPIPYYGADVAGSLIVPGGQAKGLARAATLATQVLGNTEADLTKGDSQELLQLGKEGAITGSIDAAFPLVGKGLKSIGSAVSKNASKLGEALKEGPLEDLMKIYDASKKGLPVYGKKALEAAEKEVKDVSGEVADTLKNRGQDLAKKQGEILRNSNKTISIQPELDVAGGQVEQLRQILGSDTFKSSDKKFQQEIQDIVNQYGSEELTPKALNEVKKKLAALSDYTDEASKISHDGILNVVKDLESSVRNKAYKEIPEYGEVNKQLTEYAKDMTDLGLEKMRKYDYDPKIANQLDNKIQKTVMGIEKETEAGMKARTTFDKLKKFLSPELQDKVKQVSDYKDIAGQKMSYNPFDAGATSFAYVAGKASNLSKMPLQKIQLLSAKAKNTKGMEGLSQTLEKLSTEPNQQKRNAMIFALQQNPAYREFLNNEQDSEDIE